MTDTDRGKVRARVVAWNLGIGKTLGVPVDRRLVGTEFREIFGRCLCQNKIGAGAYSGQR